MSKLYLLLAGLFVLASAQTGFAAKPDDIESNYPLTIEDSSATDEGEFDLRFASRYAHVDRHQHDVLAQPEFEYGLARDTEINVTLPFDLGSANDDHGGDLGMEILYNFSNEKCILPAFAVSGRVDLPTGENSQGLDTTLGLLATKHVLPDLGENKIIFNAKWSRNAAAQSDEQDNGFLLTAGGSHGLNDKLTLVTDLVREQDVRDDTTENRGEVGLRYEVAHNVILSAGAGVGIGPDSPDFLVSFGVQKTF